MTVGIIDIENLRFNVCVDYVKVSKKQKDEFGNEYFEKVCDYSRKAVGPTSGSLISALCEFLLSKQLIDER